MNKHTRLSGGGQNQLFSSFSCTDFLRCRRLISPFTAVTINCAFVSPSSRVLSNSATTSCGNLALSCCDLLLIEPVAITGSPCVRCDSVYAKKIIIKGLKCDSLSSSFKSKGAIHLVSAKPGSVLSTNRASDHNVNRSNIMACIQHTQTPSKFTWLFLATRPNDKAAPVTLRTVADTEEAARAGFPGWDLTFAAKIRTETPFNAEWIEEDDIIRWSVTGWDMKPALAEMAEMDKAARHG